MSDGRVPHHSVPEYRVLVDGDVEEYSTRTDAGQRTLQDALKEIFDGAAEAAGLNPRAWARQYSGDGIYSVLPLGTDVARLMNAFVRELDAALGSYNRLRAQPTWSRIRLRMAVHIGPIHLDGATGWAGQHAVQPARLRDSAPLRAAMAAFPEADLGIIVSSEIFRDYITQGPGDPRPVVFRPVRVAVKKQTYTAYLYVPRFDVYGVEGLGPYDPPGGTEGGVPQPDTSTATGPTPGEPSSAVHGQQVNVAYGDGDAFSGNKIGRDLNIHDGREHRERRDVR